MPWWAQALIGVGIGLLAVWVALVVALLVARPTTAHLREAVRLLPDLLRLLRRLAADRTLPRAVRIRLGLLLAYLAIPIDLIPDFIPVLGYADDAIIVIVALRSTVRRAGLGAVRAHWPGTDDGFAALCRLAGLTPPAAPHQPSGRAGRREATQAYGADLRHRSAEQVEGDRALIEASNDVALRDSQW
ncbi:YkvA family protein [Plantactinospora siamensis]|uniref:YkvA family protein n=1 Tax=Plantactinospora siamensis TaxID=555372 RepID=A0ABV6NS79_9ACTN